MCFLIAHKQDFECNKVYRLLQNTESGSESFNFDPMHVFNFYQRMAVVYDWERVLKEKVSLHLSARFTSLLHASCLLSYQPLPADCDTLLWHSLELSKVVPYSREQAHD